MGFWHVPISDIEMCSVEKRSSHCKNDYLVMPSN